MNKFRKVIEAETNIILDELRLAKMDKVMMLKGIFDLKI